MWNMIMIVIMFLFSMYFSYKLHDAKSLYNTALTYGKKKAKSQVIHNMLKMKVFTHILLWLALEVTSNVIFAMVLINMLTQ